MALIDFEVHNNEMQERNAFIKEARYLLGQAREAAKDGSDWKERKDLSKRVTAFFNGTDHKKYEYNKPKKEFK